MTTNRATATYLSLAVPNTVGTYTFGPSSAASVTYSINTGCTTAVNYAGVSGGGTITDAGTISVKALITNNVAGAFTFTGTNPNTGNAKSITSGTFNMDL